MSNIKDICCNPRLHDLVLAGWPPCCATLFVVVRRRWAHAPVIHAASHFDHKKRVAWVPISMHTCGSFFSAECTIGMVWGLTALKHYGIKALWH